MPTTGEVASALEQWAPKGSAQSYDNIGLQVGRPRAPVQRGLVALDLTPQVVEEARELNTDLIITHHPLLFHSLDRVTSESFVSSLVLDLAEAGIGYYAAHTNLDAAPGGVSFALAEQLGLENCDFLQHIDDSLVKLVTFVPDEDEASVRRALAEAGAGQIGDYDACAFTSSGTGHFQPGQETSPRIGTPGGEIESASETRIEVEVARWRLTEVLRALQSVHPYDEVAYDIYPVEQSYRRAGLGVTGELPSEEHLERFLERVANRLQTTSLRYAGDLQAPVRTIAVCGGAGGDLIASAKQAGADVYLTADLTYHQYFQVLSTDGESEMALIDGGHYETEAITESLLIKWLEERFTDVTWTRTTTRTSPVTSFTYVPE